jgi:hypothetical protein
MIHLVHPYLHLKIIIWFLSSWAQMMLLMRNSHFWKGKAYPLSYEHSHLSVFFSIHWQPQLTLSGLQRIFYSLNLRIPIYVNLHQPSGFIFLFLASTVDRLYFENIFLKEPLRELVRYIMLMQSLWVSICSDLCALSSIILLNPLNNNQRTR